MAEYTIAKGDTLSKIAKKYGTTVDALASANNLSDPNRISAGAKLTIPDGGSSAAAPAAAPTSSIGVIPSDAEIRKQAENIYNPIYEATVNALTAQKQSLTTTKERTLADYAEYVNKTLLQTERALTDSLVKRGMGRSDRGTYEITTGLADVNAAAQKDIQRIEQDYATNIGNIDTQLSTAALTKEQSVAAKMLELMQYYESVRQFNEQQKLREQELALMSRRGGGGGGGGRNPNSGPSTDDIPITGEPTTGFSMGSVGALTDTLNYKSSGTVKSTFTGKSGGKYYYKGQVVSETAYKSLTNTARKSSRK